ncbi:MAG: nucleoside triphosphate pyrophosphohydrolase [Acidobacteria bacterium]|nr:nucleoside triphosphate pyrophosphohydrolase [Acidobacteriota bacterium]
MDRLREPGGCPWDREQTLGSLAGYLLEEAYEVADAVASGDADTLEEELGDLLLQIVFMARIGREKGWFTIDDVCDGISEKMIRRHPHVFGSVHVDGADDVTRNWEDIKKTERKNQPGASALDGIPNALPALLKAFRMTEKAAALGFDWDGASDAAGKLEEETKELKEELERGGNGRVREEMGDVLFTMANVARHLGVEPETALQEANRKFMSRFRTMEAGARASGTSLRDLDPHQQEALWQRAKREETAGSARLKPGRR